MKTKVLCRSLQIVRIYIKSIWELMTLSETRLLWSSEELQHLILVGWYQIPEQNIQYLNPCWVTGLLEHTQHLFGSTL